LHSHGSFFEHRKIVPPGVWPEEFAMIGFGRSFHAGRHALS
jgi:hypothetical protein